MVDSSHLEMDEPTAADVTSQEEDVENQSLGEKAQESEYDEPAESVPSKDSSYDEVTIHDEKDNEVKDLESLLTQKVHEVKVLESKMDALQSVEPHENEDFPVPSLAATGSDSESDSF
jgi:hypothetical protein